jgi:hypothetical protein
MLTRLTQMVAVRPSFSDPVLERGRRFYAAQAQNRCIERSARDSADERSRRPAGIGVLKKGLHGAAGDLGGARRPGPPPPGLGFWRAKAVSSQL